MIEVKLYLLGDVRFENQGRRVEIDTRKALALAAYLALSGRAHTRDTLAALLWPESDQSAARGALRRTLSTLRKAVGEDILQTPGDSLELNLEAGLWVDVVAFKDLIEVVEAHHGPDQPLCKACLQQLEEAASLHQGIFMEGFSLRDSLNFDDWQFQQTEQLRRQHSLVLNRLVDGYSRLGKTDLALDYARQWLALDPLNERAHRSLIEQYVYNGQRSAALRQYRACVRILEEELGVAPMQETTAVYEAVRTNQLPSPRVADRDQQQFQEMLPEKKSAVQETTAIRPPTGSTQLPLVGREQELATLLQIYGRMDQSGQVVNLRGEAGIGKTRLAEEFLEQVRHQGGSVLKARCYEGEHNLAYGAIVEALRDGVLQVDDQNWLRELSGFELVEAARLLPELGAYIPDSGVVLPLEGPGAQARFYEGVTRVLLSLANSRDPKPGVIFIDDLQWADEGSGHILAYIAHRLARQPLLLLTCWREDGLLDEARLRELTSVPARQGSLTEMALARLQPNDIQQIFAVMKSQGRDLPADLRQQVVQDAEGVPFFLVAYLHAWQRQGRPDNGSAEPPASIQTLLKKRLSMVSEPGLQLLQTAAVLGRSFSYDQLLEVSGRSEMEAVTALDELEVRGLLSPIHSSSNEPAAELIYDFNHEQMRLVVYQQLSMVRRRLLHRRAADSLARRLVPGSSMAYAGQVAQHYREAGEPAAAARYYRLAGEYAAELYANQEALAHFEAALALGDPDRAGIYREIGKLEVLLGNFGSAIQNFEAAAALADPEKLPEIEHRLGQVYERLGEWEQAEGYYLSALQALEKMPDHTLAIRLRADWSLLLHRQGKSLEATEMALEARQAAERLQDPQALAQVLNLLGILARHRNEPQQASQFIQSSLELAKEMKNLPAQTAALNNLALAFGDQYDYDRALELVRTALELSVQQGDRHREAAARNNLADLLQAAGDEQAAMQQLKKAVAIFAEIGLDTGSLQPEVWKLVEW